MRAATIDPHGAMTAPASPPPAAAAIRAIATVPARGYRCPDLVAALALGAGHHLRAEAHRIVDDSRADDPVVAAAARTVHARDAACTVLVDSVNRPTATDFAEGRARMLHTESLGQLIARRVTVWTRGELLADTRMNADDPDVRLASAQLGELGRAYDDPVTDRRLGRRRHLLLQTPTGPAGRQD